MRLGGFCFSVFKPNSTSARFSLSVHLTFFLGISPSSSALMESLINPLQDRIEDWKKTANQLDKDHAKGNLSGTDLPQ